MVICHPHKPRSVYKPSQMSLKIANDKKAVERRRDELELEDALKEVWDE